MSKVSRRFLVKKENINHLTTWQVGQKTFTRPIARQATRASCANCMVQTAGPRVHFSSQIRLVKFKQYIHYTYFLYEQFYKNTRLINLKQIKNNPASAEEQSLKFSV